MVKLLVFEIFWIEAHVNHKYISHFPKPVLDDLLHDHESVALQVFDHMPLSFGMVALHVGVRGKPVSTIFHRWRRFKYMCAFVATGFFFALPYFFNA